MKLGFKLIAFPKLSLPKDLNFSSFKKEFNTIASILDLNNIK